MPQLAPTLLTLTLMVTSLFGQAVTDQANPPQAPTSTFFDLVALSRLHRLSVGGPEVGFYLEYLNRTGSAVSVLAHVPKDTGDYGEIRNEDGKDTTGNWQVIQPGKTLRVFVNRTLPPKYYLRATDLHGARCWGEGATTDLPIGGKTVTFNSVDSDSQCQEIDGVVVCRHVLSGAAGVASAPSIGSPKPLKLADFQHAAQACVQEGAWEDAVAHLQKAVASATENYIATEGTYFRIRKEHEAKLVEWRETIAKQEQRLKDLDVQSDRTEAQVKRRTQIQGVLDEHQTAVTHSEGSLKEIDRVLAQLLKEKEICEVSLAGWQEFLTREKQEIALAGSSSKYAAEKLEQVKGDDARPKADRLAYARRLLRLDPENAACKRFVRGLMRAEEPAKPSTEKAKKKG